MLDPVTVSVIAVFMIALGAGFIYFIVRGNEKPWPKDGVQWAASLLSLLLVVFAGLLLSLTLIATQQAPEGVGMQATRLNVPADDFNFRLVGTDEEYRLADYRGQVVLLNFWATWCAPCISELPELNRLQETYGDDGLVILTISDETRPELEAFESWLPLNTVSGYLPNPPALPESYWSLFDVRPTTYIIDREGYVRFYVEGAGNYDYFEQAVLPHLQNNLAAR